MSNKERRFDMPKKENAIEARGRNGWFAPNEVRIGRYADRLTVGVVSRRLGGGNDPIFLTGSVNPVLEG